MKYVYDELPTEAYFFDKLNALAKVIKDNFYDGDEKLYDAAVDQFFELAWQYMNIHYPECHLLSAYDEPGYITGLAFQEYSGTPPKKEVFFES